MTRHTDSIIQAADAIESLKMESPVKQPIFVSEANKENIERDEVAVPVKGIPLDYEPETEVKATVAEGIKEEEAIEPILQENPNRFVLFPIKYHEVGLDACITSPWLVHTLTDSTDLANVQEG